MKYSYNDTTLHNTGILLSTHIMIESNIESSVGVLHGYWGCFFLSVKWM